jgi:dipeptidase E
MKKKQYRSAFIGCISYSTLYFQVNYVNQDRIKSMKLLLISNSTQYGRGYLEHCEEQTRELLRGCRQIVFVPFALHDWDNYTEVVRKRFHEMGYQLSGIHENGNMPENLERADAVFIGGGNTFRLLDLLYKNGLIEPLSKQVLDGKPYMGTSAGSNVACCSIKTTNDMPIVYPPSFNALNLVPFNINPHYIAPDPARQHMGETRDQRIREFHEMNDYPVVGLREGAMLNIRDSRILLQGSTGARVFLKQRKPLDYKNGDDLSFLLK